MVQVAGSHTPHSHLGCSGQGGYDAVTIIWRRLHFFAAEDEVERTQRLSITSLGETVLPPNIFTSKITSHNNIPRPSPTHAMRSPNSIFIRAITSAKAIKNTTFAPLSSPPMSVKYCAVVIPISSIAVMSVGPYILYSVHIYSL